MSEIINVIINHLLSTPSFNTYYYLKYNTFKFTSVKTTSLLQQTKSNFENPGEQIYALNR